MGRFKPLSGLLSSLPGSSLEQLWARFRLIHKLQSEQGLEAGSGIHQQSLEVFLLPVLFNNNPIFTGGPTEYRDSKLAFQLSLALNLDHQHPLWPKGKIILAKMKVRRPVNIRA